jgi:hypothetical protein
MFLNRTTASCRALDVARDAVAGRDAVPVEDVRGGGGGGGPRREEPRRRRERLRGAGRRRRRRERERGLDDDRE